MKKAIQEKDEKKQKDNNNNESDKDNSKKESEANTTRSPEFEPKRNDEIGLPNPSQTPAEIDLNPPD